MLCQSLRKRALMFLRHLQFPSDAFLSIETIWNVIIVKIFHINPNFYFLTNNRLRLVRCFLLPMLMFTTSPARVTKTTNLNNLLNRNRTKKKLKN